MLANANASRLIASPDRDRIHPVGTLVELSVIAAAFIVFNLLPDKIGFIRSLTDHPASFRPFLAPEFQSHLPLLNLYWSMAFGLCVANLVTGRWNTGTRGLDAALSILGIGVLIALVSGGPLTLYRWLDLVVKFGFAVAIIPSIVDAVRKVRRLLREETTVSYP